jgi:4-alpha-glucanotransferase
MITDRASGILLHLTSLPGAHGMGDLGPNAYRFADFLERAGQSVWQVLPLVPVGLGNSPYASPSTFANNPLLISPERLRETGLLREDDFTEERGSFPDDHVDFGRVVPYRRRLLERAFERFEQGESELDRAAFEAFCEARSDWLDDYVLFMTLREAHGETRWTEWPRPLAQRKPKALARARRKHARTIRMHKFWQFLFDRQWTALKRYCNRRGIRIFGDLPIYVAHDSADVWAHPDLFHLNDDGHPTVVAGVPPDYFSETGQRWGNPIYRWDLMKERGYRWWTRRLRSILRQTDLVRLDHFRAFEAYWEIPAGEETAVAGHWRDGPGAAFFKAMRDALGALPVVAEDLGTITPEVTALMNEFDLPGMAVLQFAFDSGKPDSTYLPHRFEQNLAAYTGTHDNNTLAGWWNEVTQNRPEAHRFARRYLDFDGRAPHWAAIRALMRSVARLAVFPMQDVLGLDSEARMNVPGRSSANWRWRLRPDQLERTDADRLRRLAATYGRAAMRDEHVAEPAAAENEREHAAPVDEGMEV